MKLKDFEGRWTLDRTIENAVGPDATFRGTATFTRDGEGLILQEVGEMTVAGQPPLRATRGYLWRQGPAGIDVYFDDGRYFHHIADGAASEDRHDCAPDLYQVAYDFRDWPVWSTIWRVTGPRKDYVMRTRFQRG